MSQRYRSHRRDRINQHLHENKQKQHILKRNNSLTKVENYLQIKYIKIHQNKVKLLSYKEQFDSKKLITQVSQYFQQFNEFFTFRSSIFLKNQTAQWSKSFYNYILFDALHRFNLKQLNYRQQQQQNNQRNELKHQTIDQFFSIILFTVCLKNQRQTKLQLYFKGQLNYRLIFRRVHFLMEV